MAVRIKPAETGRDIKKFVYFPGELYKDDPLYVPPIWISDYLEYKKGKNAVLSHSDYRMFGAWKDGKIVGRLIAYVDHNFNAFYSSKTGFFGAFESADDPDVAAALFDAAQEYLKDKGMDTIRGPIDPVAECWGFVNSGYDTHPVFMSPYNRENYNKFAEAAGFKKAKDLLVLEADMEGGYVIPERFERFSSRFLKEKPDFTLRRIDVRNIKAEAEHIWHIMNTAVSGNWGYVPLERAEVEDIVGKLKLIVDPDAVWFVEDRGVPVGCALGFPDINILIKEIKGKLFPFGIIKLLTGIKKLRDYRLWALAVLPEYHGMGLDVLLYTSLNEALKERKIRMEANYILEDNPHIRNALEKLGMKLIKSYRVYEKSISLDGME